jgi:hypothetical protein
MTKGFADSRFVGHKRYMPAVGLFRPTVVLDNQKALSIKNILPKSKRRKEWTYYSQWQGEVVHEEYDLGRGAEYNELSDGIKSILTTEQEVVEW